MSSSADAYLLDNRAEPAGQRFGALAALFDPVTRRHVAALGIDRGWRCWEIGAGGASVPAWLAEQVGPGGYVLATDIDTSWIDQAATPAFEVRRHDMAQDEPPAGGFDLVHARLVLSHVPARREALRRMAGSLRPGGWLLVEDFDVALQPLASLSADGPDEERANRMRAGFLELLAERGADLELGRRLPRELRVLGLEDVAADAYFPVALAAGAALEQANVEQVRSALRSRGHASEQEIDDHLGAVAGGLVDVVTPPLVSAWGRRSRGGRLRGMRARAPLE